jgi:adenine phosphoribosyltransferase
MVAPWPRLRESLAKAPVVRRGDYDYFVHPLTDGVLPVDESLLREAIEAVDALLPRRFDVVVAPEAMALPLAAGITLTSGRPFVVARKRSYGLPGEQAVPYATGYSQGTFSVNGLRPNQNVVIVDDVVSRGGTIRAIAKAVRGAGARLVHVVILVNKDADLAALAREIDAPVSAVARIRVRDGRVEVLSDATPRLHA